MTTTPKKRRQLLAEAGYPDGFEIHWDIYQYGTGELGGVLDSA